MVFTASKFKHLKKRKRPRELGGSCITSRFFFTLSLLPTQTSQTSVKPAKGRNVGLF
jgi:hypothetical protein